MQLVLEAVVVDVDDAGHIKSRLPDVSGMALRLDGTEIDGIGFSLKEDDDRIEICMRGEGLSEEITSNYPARPHTPVMQIGFRDPAARLTANTLNKLIRRANKLFPGKALLIRDVKT